MKCLPTRHKDQGLVSSSRVVEGHNVEAGESKIQGRFDYVGSLRQIGLDALSRSN